MSATSDPGAAKWLEWVRRLQAIAQAGASFSTEPYDLDRYGQIKEIAAEMAADRSVIPIGTVQDLFSRDAGWVTPKVAVRAVILRDDAILLVREKRNLKWTLPGGLVDAQESFVSAVQREVQDEAGCSCRPTRLLSVWDAKSARFNNYITLFFECELGGPIRFAHSIETSDANFFDLDDLPELVVPGGREQINRLIEIRSDPGRPADFG